MTKEMVKMINKASGRYSDQEVFKDFVKMYAIAIHNSSVQYSDEREQEYLKTIKKYTDQEKEIFVDFCTQLVIELDNEVKDVLGEIFEELKMGNKKNQFFTPINVANLIAELVGNDNNNPITFNDPCCGSGALTIGYCKKFIDQKINYQDKMRVLAQDRDRDVLLMAYVQFSLLGIEAVCDVSDVLNGEIYDRWFTPMYIWHKNSVNITA